MQHLSVTSSAWLEKQPESSTVDLELDLKVDNPMNVEKINYICF